MIIKRNILFFIDKEGNKETGYKPDGKLRLRIRYNSGKIDFNVGYRVVIEKWSKETQRCKSGTTHGTKKVPATEINKEIQRLENLTNSIFKKFEVKELLPSTEEFREAFNLENNRITNNSTKSTNNFYSVFDKFLDECSTQNNWAEATYKKLKTTKNHLEKFDPNISFESLNESKLMAYMDYVKNDLSSRNSTLAKQLKLLKWFLKWAKKKGYTKSNDFEHFKPKIKNTENKVIFLTTEELNQLINFEIPESKKYLGRLRDVFIFLCYTGLRHSDAFNLKRSNVKENHIEVTTHKTTDNLIIELNDRSKAILKKYENIQFEDDKVLPVISNQDSNRYIKELAELAGISENVNQIYYKGNERIELVTPKYKLLSTHAGRRTFICKALSLGIPVHVVMKWTGHKDYKSMKPYIDVADNLKANEMKKFNL
ncbi:tyrosine-type recombinase/integrase [Sunxiuqinia elliptica]